MDDEERQQLIIGLAQTIAMQALELRLRDARTSSSAPVMAVQAEFERKYGPDPALAEAATSSGC
jgi:hypothetical protein